MNFLSGLFTGENASHPVSTTSEVSLAGSSQAAAPQDPPGTLSSCRTILCLNKSYTAITRL